MKPNSFFVVAVIFALVVLSACSHISLSGKNQGGSSSVGSKSAIPLIEGEWEVDYEFKGGFYVANAMFSQSGAQLVGQGVDQDGLEWTLEQGQVNGTKVSFSKVYLNANPPRPPVVYTGELKHLESPEYTGWMMEGTYSAALPNGKTLTGKWVSNPTAPQAAPAASNPAFIPPPGQTSPASAQPEPLGSAKPGDLSGRYDVGYQYNFKKVISKMWLRQDGGKLSGDGVDTTTGEKFIITKGTYSYPNVMIVRQYIKGKGAKESRSVTFKAQLSSDGTHIMMKGETQFGGHWDARLAR